MKGFDLGAVRKRKLQAPQRLESHHIFIYKFCVHIFECFKKNLKVQILFQVFHAKEKKIKYELLKRLQEMCCSFFYST